MKLGSPINIRLSIASEAAYEAEARSRNLPLRTYLRQKLEKGDDITEEISRLRIAIEQISLSSQQSNGTSGESLASGGQNLSILLEILLLLRQIAQPHRVQLAQQELRRLGFEIWEGPKNDGS